MPTIKYVGAIDEVDVVLLGQTVKRGDEVEVSDEHAKALLSQPDNFAPVQDAMDVMTVEELRDLADQHGVDLTGLTKKADIVAAIKKG